MYLSSVYRFYYNQLMHKYKYRYITIFSLYIMFTTTCFDISVSLSESFKNLYFSKLHKFLKLKLLKLQFHIIFIIFNYISIILI